MVLPNMTTNLFNGITNVKDATAATLGSYVANDPSRVHQWFEDFDQYTTADWVISGTAGTGTIAVQNEDGGILKITTGGTEDDARWLQWAGNTSASVVETFKWEAGRGLWFKSRFKVDTATESDWVMGLQITDTTPIDAGDGFAFVKVDGATLVNFVVNKNGTATTLPVVTTLPTTDYVTMGFWWNPDLGVLTVYYNDNPVASTTTTTNFPDDQTLAISFGAAAGTGAAVAMSVDYIVAAKDRQATIA